MDSPAIVKPASALETIDELYVSESFGVTYQQAGPIDPLTYSPLPYFLRLRGSVLPKMIIPLLFVGGWSAMIVCISRFHTYLGVNSYHPLT